MGENGGRTALDARRPPSCGRLREEARVHQVQERVLDAADVLVAGIQPSTICGSDGATSGEDRQYRE